MVKTINALAKLSKLSTTLGKVGKSFEVLSKAFNELKALEGIWSNKPLPPSKTETEKKTEKTDK